MEFHASNPYVYIGDKCAVCGTTKGETNTWLVSVPTKEGILLSSWDPAILHISGSRPICGATCVQKESSMALALGEKVTKQSVSSSSPSSGNANFVENFVEARK